jgi:hypothetical protein
MSLHGSCLHKMSPSRPLRLNKDAEGPTAKRQQLIAHKSPALTSRRLAGSPHGLHGPVCALDHIQQQDRIPPSRGASQGQTTLAEVDVRRGGSCRINTLEASGAERSLAKTGVEPFRWRRALLRLRLRLTARPTALHSSPRPGTPIPCLARRGHALARGLGWRQV